MTNTKRANFKVSGIRYWQTRNGVGYEAPVKFEGEYIGTIWNDGDGGGSWFRFKPGAEPGAELHWLRKEDNLELLLDAYENVVRDSEGKTISINDKKVGQ